MEERNKKVQGLHDLIYNIELRDLFAVAIAAGIGSNPSIIKWDMGIAFDAYFFADLLLEAREATRK